MLDIKKRYVIDENDRRVAVQIDLETFEKIEELLENSGLAHSIAEAAADDRLDLEAAKEYYASLDKAP
jgi:PHD/YefM family antitoxin component YafN of YafNO toxin-antitoxin module